LKILHITNSFINAKITGGVSSFVTDLTMQLAGQNNSVSVLSTNRGLNNYSIKYNAYTNINGVNAYYLRNISKKLADWGIPLPRGVKHYFTKLPKSCCDIVHIHELSRIMNIFTYGYVKKNNIPYILQTHGCLTQSPYLIKRVLNRIFYFCAGKRILQNAEYVVALNNHEAKLIESHGVNKKQIVCISNGIKIDSLNRSLDSRFIRDKYNIPSDNKLIIYIGRLAITKRIDLLIESFSLMVKRKQMTKVTLCIVGQDYGVLKKLKKMVNSEGISDSVLFLGFIDKHEKLALFNEADLMCVPAFYGFPITIIESCMMGTPVCVTTLGDYLPWIRDVGLITNPLPESMADSISKLLLDDVWLSTLSTKCKRYALEHFSIDVISNKYIELYQQIVNNRSH
jgi:glycosyltransferase involved in cell wall biosynthesis